MTVARNRASAPRWSSSRWPPLAIWLSTLALLALVWTHVWFQAHDMSSRAFVAANQSLNDLTRVTQEHAVRTLRGADQALRFVVVRYQADGQQLNLKELVDSGVIDTGLFAQVGIIDANGIYSLASIPFKQGLDLSDREHFKVHVLADTQQMFVSQPVLGRASGKWTIQLTRRINRADGSFGGVAVVSMDAQYFTRFYSELTPLADDRTALTALTGLDGVIRVRQMGQQESFGQNVGKSFVQALIAGGTEQGSYTIESPLDGVERLFIYRRIPGYELLSLNGVSTSAIRASYQSTQTALMLQASVLSLLLLIMAVAFTRYTTYLQRILAQRGQATQALRLSEERLALALLGGEQGAWDWDLTQDSMYVSDLMRKMMGFEGDEHYLTKQQRLSAVHPDDRERAQTSLREHLRGQGDLFQIELRLRSLTDGYKWMLIRGKVVDQKDGRSTRVAGSATDISEQRFAQDQVADRTAQLDALFTLSPDAFVTFDRTHRVKYVNPAFSTMTGLSATEVKQLSEDAFSAKLGKLCSRAKPFEKVATLRLDAANQAETQHGLVELLSPKRSMLKVGLKLSASASVSQILYFRDVTHETIVEDMKTEFLSTAAHELRTPMASVLGFAEVLLTQDLDLASQQEFLNIILKQSKHLSTILDELLDLARIEARQGKDFELQTVELCGLVQQVVNDFKTPAGRSPPVVNLPATFCLVDAGKAKQVVLNVISNAYKYSSPGTAVTITTAQAQTHADTGTALVGMTIQDQGIGMNEAQLARVFERFYRADASGTVLGTGLGLSIVKEIMELHRGTVAIQSALGTGTRVTLMFPVESASTP